MSAVAQNKILSLDYIGHNIRYYFVETLPIMREKPYVRISPEGNSVFSVYPYTLLLLAIPFIFKKLYKHMKKYQRIIFMQMLVASAALMMFLLSFYATGWVRLF
jgi:hypothetical protein